MDQLSYLVDTNIFVELILDQEKADEAQSFLDRIPNKNLFISDFSLYSIGIILFRLKRLDLFSDFLNEIILDGIRVLSLEENDLIQVEATTIQYKLDFDDTYQYLLAEKNNLKLVSFDKDFDKTPNKRTTPQEVLKEQKEQE